MLMQEVLKNLHVTHSSMYNILTFRILVCCVRTIKSNSNKYLSTMKNNMGHFSLGAWPSPAQPSSGGQGFRRSWVQGSGDQGVREWVRVSRDHKGSGCIRVSGVHGFRGQGVRGSGGQEAGQGVRGSGGQGFMGSGVRR